MNPMDAATIRLFRIQPRVVIPLMLVLFGCLPEQEPETVRVALEYQEKSRLPLSPHARQLRARPTPEMVQGSSGQPLRFMILDKRTLKVHRLTIRVGERVAAPWGGWIHPMAFLSDLVIRKGVVIHGPEGHVNAVAWVELQDKAEKNLHEGWLFVRDTAQTAWDHPRYDITFLGREERESKPQKNRR